MARLAGPVVPEGERIRLCAHTCVREDHNAERERYRALRPDDNAKRTGSFMRLVSFMSRLIVVNDSSLTKATGKVCPSCCWKYVRDQRQAGPDE